MSLRSVCWGGGEEERLSAAQNCCHLDKPLKVAVILINRRDGSANPSVAVEIALHTGPLRRSLVPGTACFVGMMERGACERFEGAVVLQESYRDRMLRSELLDNELWRLVFGLQTRYYF